MAIPKQGFQNQGGSPDFGGTHKKGTPQRKALSMALKMLAETLLAHRQKQTLTPENDEQDSPEDRDSPEARKTEESYGPGHGHGGGGGMFDGGNGGRQPRRAKSKTLYGDAKSSAKPASSSKPEGIKKGSRFG